MACNMTPVFIKSDSVLGAALMNENGSARPTLQESSVYDRVMSRIQNVCTVQSVEENTLLGVEFWESLKKGTLQWITVSGGLYVYDYGQGLDFGSVDDHGNLILRNEHYGQCIEDYYTLVTTVEVSEPSQDWRGQEMIQPHVRVIKEMLKFTDSQIRNGLEMLHGRGEAITFASLIHILVMREDAVVNVYVGTRQYAFSADVQLVLHECYDFYGREPTQAEFDYQYNRIKEHLINQLAVKDEEVTNINREMTNINRDKERLQERARLLDNQVTMEQARAVQERNRADHRHREKLEALKEANTAMEARNEAQELANEAVDGIIQEQNKARALEETMRLKTVKLEQEKEAERVKAEAERVKAVKLGEEMEEEKVKAEAERVKNVKLEQEKEEEKVKAEAERVKNVKLEQEKEEEKVKAEAERVKAVKLEQEKEEEKVKAEAERVKAVKLEQEKEEERVKAEAGRVKAEAEREQLIQFFEEEKRKMMAQFEAEKRQLLLKMQQPSLYAR